MSKSFNPRQFMSSSGKPILVGRNSSENNYLTLKVAQKTDIFFHATDFPGSHVILQTNGADITKDDLEDAACLAAFYSKGKDRKTVKVDFALKENVSKARKAPAGLVELHSYRTIKVKKIDNRIKKFI